MCCERILDTRCYKTVWAERNDAYKIMSMAVIGILIGLLVKGTAEEGKPNETLVVYLALLGNMWIKTLKMIVLPFMLTNMSTSVAETKMLKNTGGLAKITFMWYIATTCAACVMGITMGSLFLLPTIDLIIRRRSGLQRNQSHANRRNSSFNESTKDKWSKVEKLLKIQN